ncbi:TRAP transporter small permease [Roseomonas sp. PWR1]|uniref:TRAP transporter small permease protein n=2 Tax=Roseomonas nitratireducens TaxID=2820810 RepID=A0ABS4AN43_9PROT|nr:TRAP transporter small permease [Neoroseomonas nitratireducens]
MAAMALITAANVVTRYLSNVSLAFTEEYSVALMVVVALLGTALATATGRHIRIGVLVDGLSPAHRRMAEAAAMVLTILCFGLLAWYGARLTWDEYRFEVLSNGLGHPNWIYTGWLPLLSLVVIARAAGRLARVLRGGEW